jgi:phenylpropionate dioxygenase-like ring-hydroxylating dioxygenase large terminal subunit
MYINFWYPIAKSTDVSAEKPLHVKLLCLPFVAFRDAAGGAHVLSDTCVHRGGALSKGQIKDGCVACPYHGWEFSGDGTCVKIPSLGPDAKLPTRARVDSYPVQEKYGIVFAFLGDLPESERPPLYDIEEYGTPQWRAQLFVLDVNAYYERSIENGLDPIHNEFVHPAQGQPSLPAELQRRGYPVEDIPWGSKFFLAFGERAHADTALKDVKSGAHVGSAGSWHQGPNQLVTWIQLTPTNAFHQYLFEAPVDETHTRIFLVSLRNWLLDEKLDPRMEQATLAIVREDVGILENLNPVRTPDSNNKELLVPGDIAVVRYREWLKKWDEKGWRIDYKALYGRLGDDALAIPSPARRNSPNWVLGTVPLLPGA